MKILALLLVACLSGCATHIPFEWDFNRVKKFQAKKEEKLVLGKQIAPGTAEPTEKLKLSVKKNTTFSWQKSF